MELIKINKYRLLTKKPFIIIPSKINVIDEITLRKNKRANKTSIKKMHYVPKRHKAIAFKAKINEAVDKFDNFYSRHKSYIILVPYKIARYFFSNIGKKKYEHPYIEPYIEKQIKMSFSNYYIFFITNQEDITVIRDCKFTGTRKAVKIHVN